MCWCGKTEYSCGHRLRGKLKHPCSMARRRHRAALRATCAVLFPPTMVYCEILYEDVKIDPNLCPSCAQTAYDAQQALRSHKGPRASLADTHKKLDERIKKWKDEEDLHRQRLAGISGPVLPAPPPAMVNWDNGSVAAPTSFYTPTPPPAAPRVGYPPASRTRSPRPHVDTKIHPLRDQCHLEYPAPVPIEMAEHMAQLQIKAEAAEQHRQQTRGRSLTRPSRLPGPPGPPPTHPLPPNPPRPAVIAGQSRQLQAKHAMPSSGLPRRTATTPIAGKSSLSTSRSASSRLPRPAEPSAAPYTSSSSAAARKQYGPDPHIRAKIDGLTERENRFYAQQNAAAGAGPSSATMKTSSTPSTAPSRISASIGPTFDLTKQHPPTTFDDVRLRPTGAAPRRPEWSRENRQDRKNVRLTARSDALREGVAGLGRAAKAAATAASAPASKPLSRQASGKARSQRGRSRDPKGKGKEVEWPLVGNEASVAHELREAAQLGKKFIASFVPDDSSSSDNSSFACVDARRVEAEGRRRRAAEGE